MIPTSGWAAGERSVGLSALSLSHHFRLRWSEGAAFCVDLQSDIFMLWMFFTWKSHKQAAGSLSIHILIM